MQELGTYLSEIAQLTERKLEELLVGEDKDYCVLQQAMRYSACGGGKRIRPFLCVAVCEMLGGDPQKALTVAAALEMVHTYSLIHDDLPCMDNDDLRRGRPTCHVRYGEATALLAGDALLTLAFEVIAAEPTLTHEQRVTAVSVLARAAGHNGMIAGQVMDLAAEDKEDVSLAELKKLQQLKTGAMILAAVRLGAVAADKADGDLLQALDVYADRVGLAFQMIDDYLDVNGDESIFGKPVGSDAEQGKTTFMTKLTPEEVLFTAKQLTAEACEAVRPYDRECVLAQLAEYLLTRKA